MMIQIPLSLLVTAIPNARLSGRPDVLVSRLTADSRDLRPRDIFACIRGRHYDGHLFAAQAVAAGAVAVLADRPLLGMTVPVIEVSDVSQALKQLAPRFYNFPGLRLTLIGVTGTSGKTTVTHLIQAILATERKGRTRKHKVGLLGTIHHDLGKKMVAAHNTTPMAWDVQSLLYQIEDNGCDVAVLEVSSHALAQDRVYQCEFDIAVFTNLTPEHLDFHRTMDDYAATKSKLFAQLAQPGFKTTPKYAVVNQDDPRGPEMARAARGVRVVTFGLQPTSDVTAREIHLSSGHSSFRLVTPAGEIEITWSLLGLYNVSNALAAAAVAHCMGVGLTTIREGLGNVSGVPGRVQKVEGKHPFTVLVDYAHKPDALQKMLQAVREFASKRLLLVFGCGGERDTSKRAVMGEIAARLADVTIITSDNPRSEDPQKIIQEILIGCRRVRQTPEAMETSVRVEVDRETAIHLAIQSAQPGDVVVLAGKGHEAYQIIGEQTIPMDDYRLAQKEIAHWLAEHPATGQKSKANSRGRSLSRKNKSSSM